MSVSGSANYTEGLNAAEVDVKVAAAISTDGALLKASNLSDLASVATAKTNLSLQNVDNTSDAAKVVASCTGSSGSCTGNAATSTTCPSGTSTGTNTGDQTITLTGDVTGSGTGSFAATIAAQAVGVAKMTVSATARFFGRVTAGAGVAEELTAAQMKTALSYLQAGDALGTPASGTLTNCVGTEVDLVFEVAGAALVASADPVKYIYYANRAMTILGAWVVTDAAATVAPAANPNDLVTTVKNQGATTKLTLTRTSAFTAGTVVAMTISDSAIAAGDTLTWTITQNGSCSLGSGTGLRLILAMKVAA